MEVWHRLAFAVKSSPRYSVCKINATQAKSQRFGEGHAKSSYVTLVPSSLLLYSSSTLRAQCQTNPVFKNVYTLKQMIHSSFMGL